MTTHTDSLTGKIIGRYKVGEIIGRGGMATVYKAQHLELEREAALKIIAPHHISDQFLKRFNREAKISGKLQHPYIAHFYDYGMYEGGPYIVMAYMDGGTLAALMRNEEPVPVADVVHYIKQVAGALDYAHSEQLVHRDVKPDNILLDNSGNAYLADFGLVKVHEATQNLTGSAIIGTPHYMAPEVILVEDEAASPTVDVYALGVTVYELLTKKRPYTGNSPVEIMKKHVSAPIPKLSNERPNLPTAFSDVVTKAMAKYPDERYQTATAFAEAMEEALANHAPKTPQPDGVGKTEPETPKTTSFQLPVQAVIGFFALIAVVVGLFTFLGPSETHVEVVEPYITAGGNAASVRGVALSGDGSLCAAAGVDNKILIWETTDGERLYALEGHEGVPQAVVFSPDGELVASGSTTAEIIVWSALTGETLETLEGHSDGITSLAFSPDGTQLLSGSLDGSVNLWDIESGTVLQAIDSGSPVRSAEFAPDMVTIAIATNSGIVTIWDRESGTLLQELTGDQADLKSISFSPDGSLLASASEDGSIVMWNVTEGSVVNEFNPSEDAIDAVVFSPDGETLVAGGPNGKAVELSAETGATQRQFDVDDGDIVSVAVSKNGEVFAASTDEGQIFMFQ